MVGDWPEGSSSQRAVAQQDLTRGGQAGVGRLQRAAMRPGRGPECSWAGWTRALEACFLQGHIGPLASHAFSRGLIP